MTTEELWASLEENKEEAERLNADQVRVRGNSVNCEKAHFHVDQIGTSNTSANYK